MRKFPFSIPTTRSVSVWPIISDPRSGDPDYVMMLRRGANHSIGQYEVVTGKVDHDHETHGEAAVREMFEESACSCPPTG